MKTAKNMLTQKAIKAGHSLLRAAAAEGQTVLLRSAGDGYEVVQRSHADGCTVVASHTFLRLADANTAFRKAETDETFVVGAR